MVEIESKEKGLEVRDETGQASAQLTGLSVSGSIFEQEPDDGEKKKKKSPKGQGPAQKQKASSKKLQERLAAMAAKLDDGKNLAPIGGDPLSEFLVVELTMKGLSRAVKKLDDRVMHAVFLMGEDERSEFGGMKVKAYRALKAEASFTIENKHVVPMRNMKELEDTFKGISGDFKDAARRFWTKLDNNWDLIITDLRQTHPDLMISESDLKDLKPEDMSFLEMDYSARKLTDWLKEMKELKELFEQTDMNNPDAADRFKRQQEAVLEQVRVGYEEKLTKMKQVVKNLTKLSEKKYAKQVAKFDDMVEDTRDMATVLGEGKSFMDRLEDMKKELI